MLLTQINTREKRIRGGMVVAGLSDRQDEMNAM
jgi:hypothetical protein